MSPDLHALADAWLDGELAPDAWEAARAADPAGCDRALAEVRARRAALAGLARPALPADLRQRILAASAAPARVVAAAPTPMAPAPSSTRGWWRYAVPAALAAGLATAVLLSPRDASRPEPSPSVARQEPSERRAEAMAAPSAPAAAAPVEITAAELAADDLARTRAEEVGTSQPSPVDADVVASARAAASADPAPEPAAQAVADAPPAPAPAEVAADAPAAPAAPAEAATAMAPGPLTLQLAWKEPAPAARGQAEVGRRSAFSRGQDSPISDTTPALSDAPPTVSAAESAPAPAAAALADVPPADEARGLVITLRNETVGDLRVAAGGIHLIGVASDGRAVWRTVLRGNTDTLIPAGRSLAWVQPLAVLPPRVVRLRLEVDGQRSVEIEP